MRNKTKKLSLFCTISIMVMIGCRDNDENLNCIQEYDQSALLINVSDNLIIPAFEAFNTELDSLEGVLLELTIDLKEDKLQKARQSYVDTYLSYMPCAQYMFGPAEMYFLNEIANNFPLDTTALIKTVSTGSFSFDSLGKYDRGLPALDYLLFKYADPVAHLVWLEGHTENLDYALAIVKDLKQRMSQILLLWSDYQTQFVNNQGTDAGSSLSLLVNNLNRNFEISKRDRLGIPSGALTLNFPMPDRVEAPFSGISKRLLLASLESSQNLFRGVGHSNNEDGEGLDDVLDFAGATKDGMLLSKLIIDQYALIEQGVKAIPETLGESVKTQTDLVLEAYYKAASQVIQTKTDMTSVLCISITYVDTPSDTD